MNRAFPVTVAAAALPIFVGLALLGCDPKITGTEGDAGTGGDDGTDVQLTVTDEAAVTGAVVSMHMDILRGCLGVAAEYDSAAVAPAPRAFFTSDCVTVTEADPLLPSYELLLTGCVDSHGTTYRGGGELRADGTLDGYTFFPYGDPTEKIIADNASDVALNHSYEQGTFWLTFVRGTGGTTEGVSVGNYIRHGLLAQTATFSYDGVTFAGEPGNLADWPSTGGVVHVSWDGVGLYDISFTGGTTAQFRMQGVDYVVTMTTGEVGLAADLE
jgi:hypothetical protein